MNTETIQTNSLILSQRFYPETGGSISWLINLFGNSKDTILITHDYQITGQNQNSDFQGKIIRANILQKNWGLDSLHSISRYLKMFFLGLKYSKQKEQIYCTKIIPEGLVALTVKVFKPKLKIFAFVHGEEISAYQSSHQLKFIFNLIAKKFNRLFCNSSFTASHFLNQSNIEILNPSIDEKFFKKDYDKTALREEYGIKKNAFVLLSLGRLVAKKNHQAVLKLLPELLRQKSDIVYIVAGDGEESANLVALTKKLNIENNVIFIHNFDEQEKVKIYYLADLFVMPTKKVANDLEGFGIVYLEAQACSLPIIAGDSGGEADAAKNAVIVKNDQELKEALNRLIFP